MTIINVRDHRLYPGLVLAFSTIVIISNILSAKMCLVPFLSQPIPVGLLTYPLTFLLSDLVTELFGKVYARQMVYLTLLMNLVSFGMIEMALWLPNGGTAETELAFQAILGLSGLRIFSSLASYLVSQIVDIQLYALIKEWTGEKYLWLRNNGSTCASQLVDTILIDIIYLWWGMNMPLHEVAPIMLFSFTYKAFFSVATTPLFYGLVFLFRPARLKQLVS